ncbi:MAG TPA: phosphate ABC transporter permease PstA [Propionibacteriaceae bacterium]|nr:phosphate ABC transporter permease PstA [Propionibacteriaceae bacterium]
MSSTTPLTAPRGGRRATDGVMRGLIYLSALVAVTPLVWILVSIVSNGLHVVLSLDWWTKDLLGTTDRRAGGGALHAIVGTLEIGLVTAVIAVPIAVMAAIFLIEYARGTRWARVLSFSVDILSGIPSIVAALFIYTLMITLLGLGRSGVAASLALVLLMLPTVLRSTEEMLKLVPDSLREGAYALGLRKWKTVVQVVIPTAFSGIATGVILGLARVMGETAPLLILVAYARSLYLSPTSSNIGTLPTMINSGRSVAETLPGYERVWGAALTLILLVMGLNLLARGIARASRLKDR